MFTHVRIILIVENYVNGTGGHVKTPRSRTDLAKRPMHARKLTKKVHLAIIFTKFKLLTSRQNGRGIGAQRKIPLDLEHNQIPPTDCVCLS